MKTTARVFLLMLFGAGAVFSADVTGGADGSVPVLNSKAAPGANFDLTHWKLTLPINQAETHPAAELTAGYAHPEFFFTAPASGGMCFKAPNHGATTSGSHYSRSELREMLAPTGPASAPANNWIISTSPEAAKRNTGAVDGTLRATLAVDHVSTTGDRGKVGRVVVGQIHAPKTEVIRLYYHKRPSDARGAVYFGTDDSATGVTTYIPIIGAPGHLNPEDGISLGQIWSYEISLVGRTLTVKIMPQGGPTHVARHVIDAGYDGLAVYFKAGVYNQNNSGAPDDFVQATFFALTRAHP